MIDRIFGIDSYLEPIEALPAGFDFSARFGMMRDEDEEPRKKRWSSINGSTAVVPIKGRISKEVSPMRFFGVADGPPTTAELDAEINSLSRNPDIQNIVLHVDSPGGSVDGVRALAQTIRAARDKKKVTAIVDGKAVSAAYWLASQATEIIASSGSVIGGIGAFTVLEDTEESDRQAGVKRVLVADGSLKGLGADGRVTPELVEETKRIVVGIGQQMDEDIALGRRAKTDVVAGWHGGRVWLAEEAVSMGMIDKVQSTREAINGLATTNAPEGGTTDMSNDAQGTSPNEVAALQGQVETLTSAVEGLVNAFRQDRESRQEAAQVSAKESRDRQIRTILGHLVERGTITGSERDDYTEMLAEMSDEKAQRFIAHLNTRQPLGLTHAAVPPNETVASARRVQAQTPAPRRRAIRTISHPQGGPLPTSYDPRRSALDAAGLQAAEKVRTEGGDETAQRRAYETAVGLHSGPDTLNPWA